MKRIVYFIFICANGFSQINVVEFFESLYSDNSVKIENTYEEGYNLFCDQHQIDKDNTHNKDIFYRLYFLHELFTTDSAMDCSSNGILEIPYFWDDTRQDIDGNGYNIQRTPDVFLGDLVSEKPSYSYEGCGDFYTFGWCAEREMAFVALLRNMGYEADIIALNGHAWTQIYVSMYTNDYKDIFTITVDNTFDQFYIYEERLPCMHTCESYDYNCSICLMVEYYNPTADKPIDHILVYDTAIKRINELVINKLK
tara:strand:- start:3965 stop:4726 length:762 start_codon:yes stop_codon:yes gene_type:complete